MSARGFPALPILTATPASLRGLYIPEVLTPLAFTPLYAELSWVERLTYNQMHGQYFIEQTIFFEQMMGKPALHQLTRHASTEEMRREAFDFAEEEDKHTEWFRVLLRELDAPSYGDGDFHFLGAPAPLRMMMRLAGRAVMWLPGLLWLQLIAEERAVYFGRLFLAHADALDTRCLEVQKKHLADEPSHIRRDELFLRELWPAIPLWLRRLNARWLGWMLREFFFMPKRSGWRVVDCWLKRYPALQARRDEFKEAMRALASNPAYLDTLYPRSHLQRTLALAAPWPELAFLNDFFTG